MIHHGVGKASRYYLIIAVLAVCLSIAMACGKKGPLVPPDRHPPAEAALLSLSGEDSRVTLTWNVADRSDGVKGYAVYRASYPLSDPVCPVCHQKFHRIQDIVVPPGAREMTFAQEVPGGLHYTYQVRSYNADGLLGPVSNPVGVEVP